MRKRLNVSISRAAYKNEREKCEILKETRDAVDNYFETPRGFKPFICKVCEEPKLYSYKCNCCKKKICDDCTHRIIELLCTECVNK